MNRFTLLFACLLPGLLLLPLACRQPAGAETGQNPAVTTTTVATPTDSATGQRVIAAPEWTKNATIYEVNVRQFSPEGTFAAVTEQLPRLKELGVDILWLMPIYPVSKLRAKGSLGSPYAVANYTAVNPAYGSLADFKTLVTRVHALGMKIILDWVPNHSGWDNVWITQHPDYYTHVKGKLTDPLDPVTGKAVGWDDVADLNYDNPDLRRAMTAAMQYWLRETDIDGYRCDVAGFVPTDFWAELRPQLDKIKPVFMLAEWEDIPEQFQVCFNMNYGWSMHKLLKDIAKGKRPATAIDSLLAQNKTRFPTGYYQMHFTQNHDENTWNGTLAESFGAGADAFVVLTSTLDGMPLVYDGMESGLNKRLAFFEKDPIKWGNYGRTDFYKHLLTLKHRNRALWNGTAGGPVVKIQTSRNAQVYAFYRQRDNDRVTVLLNLSGQPQTVRLEGDGFVGSYRDIFAPGQGSVELKADMPVTLHPWEYRVLTN
jgi:alpha-amylase